MNAHIIIVNYNAGDWLKRSVSSALKYSQARVTIVDNASSDDSIKSVQSVFSKEANLEVILNATNVGFAAANNQVLQSLKHEFAVLMNPDCELRDNSLSNIIDVLNENKSIGIASCRILNTDGTLQKTCKRRFPTPKTAVIRMLGLSRFFPNSDFDYGDQQQTMGNTKLQKLEAVSGAFMVVRKSAIEQVGLLDEGYFMHCEDLDWCKRFKLAGWDIGFVGDAEVMHDKGVSSKARPIAVLWNLHCGMDRFFTKFYADSSWPLKYSVKAGIYLSFLPRAFISLIFK